MPPRSWPTTYPPPNAAAATATAAASARRARGLRRRPSPRSHASFELTLQRVREVRERRTRARLHRAERNPELRGDLALREVAPVGERDHFALAVGKRLERAVHAP